MQTFKTKGVCAEKIEFEIEEDVLKNVSFTGGCPGNLQAVAALVKGMTIEEVVTRLRGIRCSGKSTSCPDQLAKALEDAILQKSANK